MDSGWTKSNLTVQWEAYKDSVYILSALEAKNTSGTYRLFHNDFEHFTHISKHKELLFISIHYGYIDLFGPLKKC